MAVSVMINNNIIEFLKWDSDFFDIKVGKIELWRGSFDKAKFINLQEKEEYDLIYGFSNANQTPYGFWESLGFHLADCAVTLSMKFNPVQYRDIEYECCSNLSREDINVCYEISEMIAPLSRFYKEPAIGSELTKKMYRKWIDNALDGTFSDHLFVERIRGKIAGIQAIKTDNNVGAVTLIGVREGFQRQGIGRKLWNQSAGYWSNYSSKVNLVKVKFSIRNVSSFNFYIAIGFNTVESVNYIYHYSR